MISEEENHELNQLANDFTYQSIKFSPLWKLFRRNDDADQFAEELASEIRIRVNQRIDERVERLANKAEREAALEHAEVA